MAQTNVVIRPDCWVPLGTVTNGQTGGPIAIFDNTVAGCTTWVFSYDSFTFSAVSIVVQTAPNAAGDIPGAWSTFTPVSGINPNTSITQATSVFGGVTSFFPWVRVFFTSSTGAGTIRGVLYGCRNPSNCGVSSGTVTIAQPVAVDGPTAAGSPPTTPPVLVAGSDGTNVRTLSTDVNGDLINRTQSIASTTTDARTNSTFSQEASGSVVDITNISYGYLFNGTTWDRARGNAAGGAFVQGPTASGSPLAASPVLVGGTDTTNVQTFRANVFGGALPGGGTSALTDALANNPSIPQVVDSGTGSAVQSVNRVFPYNFNGSTWDRQFACTNQAYVNLSAAGLAQVIALSGSTVIRVCHVHLSTAVAMTQVDLTAGTGANCGAGTTILDSYMNVTAFATDFQPTAALRTAAGQALCVNPSGAGAIKGVIVYAQF